MATITLPAPQIITNPGFILWAPIGSTFPTNTVAGSKFTDAWPVAWIPMGATEEGSTFNYESTVEPIEVAELLDPVQYATTARTGSMAFSMAHYVLQNIKRALNGGTLTVVSGTGATQLSSYEPPEPGNEIRSLIGWESTDETVRIILRQTINAAAIASAFAKAPQKGLIACQFNMEKPAGAQPFIIYTAGADRVGV